MGLGGGTSWQDRELPNAHIPRVGKLGSSLDAPAPGMGPDAPWNRDTASVPGPAGPALATGGGGSAADPDGDDHVGIRGRLAGHRGEVT